MHKAIAITNWIYFDLVCFSAGKDEHGGFCFLLGLITASDITFFSGAEEDWRRWKTSWVFAHSSTSQVKPCARALLSNSCKTPAAFDCVNNNAVKFVCFSLKPFSSYGDEEQTENLDISTALLSCKQHPVPALGDSEPSSLPLVQLLEIETIFHCRLCS